MDLLDDTALSVENSARGIKLGAMPPTFRASLFHINDFYHYDLMPPSNISAHATEWGSAKYFQSGPALAKAGCD